MYSYKVFNQNYMDNDVADFNQINNDITAIEKQLKDNHDEEFLKEQCRVLEHMVELLGHEHEKCERDILTKKKHKADFGFSRREHWEAWVTKAATIKEQYDLARQHAKTTIKIIKQEIRSKQEQKSKNKRFMLLATFKNNSAYSTVIMTSKNHDLSKQSVALNAIKEYEKANPALEMISYTQLRSESAVEAMNTQTYMVT